MEKPLHEYRVETGGAWLAYGNKSAAAAADETETEAEERTNANGKNGTAAFGDDDDARIRRPRRSDDDDGVSDSARVVVDALDAVDLDAEGAAERHTAGLFVRADVSADVSADDGDARFEESADESESDAFLSVDESSDDDDAEESEESEETETSVSARDSENASDASDARETREARRAAGYVVGSHLENMSGGKKTELVVNAADSRRRGIRVGVVEDGRLVETWYEDSGPGEGMRVGDVYLGVVAKVIGGMQGVLVDVTGKGPPYSLMQKGVDEPALAWREADAGYERDVELERREVERARQSAASATDVDEKNADEESSPSPARSLPSASGSKEDASSPLASDARLARLERKAAASAIGSRAGGRWADAWAEGVGVSDSFDGESVAGPSSAETVAASLETFAEERTETDGGVGVATTKTTTKTVTETREETRVPPPFAWAPWRRGGGASRAAEASNDDADSRGAEASALEPKAGSSPRRRLERFEPRFSDRGGAPRWPGCRGRLGSGHARRRAGHAAGQRAQRPSCDCASYASRSQRGFMSRRRGRLRESQTRRRGARVRQVRGR